jgi:uncharacterized membrane protein YfcA
MIGVLALALLSGLLIGCIGIGGVLLVPVLALSGIDVHAAIAASMFAYIFSGVVGSWLYAAKASIAWRSALWLGAGAMPGALAGAFLAARLSGDLLLVLVGAAVAFSGLRALLRRDGETARAAYTLTPVLLLVIGVGVGAASAVTGTGGPVLLVPLLLWLRAPVLAAVGLSQTVQIPIAGLATAANLWEGQLDLRLGLVLGLGLAIGAAVGARIAHALPSRLLTRLVAIVLLLVGALLIARAGGALAWR